jgi:adenosyl cobinamide kinase/adenosyl cobinamide phosphate guanylyltransferase
MEVLEDCAAAASEKGVPVIGKCKWCRAEIIFITNENGNDVPVDAKAQKRYVRTLRGDWKLVDCFLPHHASCPRHRKK